MVCTSIKYRCSRDSIPRITTPPLFYIDPSETDPAHRYKICYAYLRPHAAVLGYSAEGIHWNAYNDGKPVTHRAADSYNQVVWDAEAKVYGCSLAPTLRFDRLDS